MCIGRQVFLKKLKAPFGPLYHFLGSDGLTRLGITLSCSLRAPTIAPCSLNCCDPISPNWLPNMVGLGQGSSAEIHLKVGVELH